LLQLVIFIHFLQLFYKRIVLVGKDIHISKGCREEVSGDVLFRLLNKLWLDVGGDALPNFVALNKQVVLACEAAARFNFLRLVRCVVLLFKYQLLVELVVLLTLV
jgi:hypothetical protein